MRGLLLHVRGHAVAYLALGVAMGGSSYAAEAVHQPIPDGSVTTSALAANAVVSPKIAPGAVGANDLAYGAVTGALVPDRSLTAADFVAGAVPAQPFVDGATTGAGDPKPEPVTLTLSSHSDYVARAGTLYIRFRSGSARLDCGTATGQAGLYVDHVPVPGSRVDLSTTAHALDIVATLPITPGTHLIEVAADCGTGTYDGSNSGISSLEYTDLTF